MLSLKNSDIIKVRCQNEGLIQETEKHPQTSRTFTKVQIMMLLKLISHLKSEIYHLKREVSVQLQQLATVMDKAET